MTALQELTPVVRPGMWRTVLPGRNTTWGPLLSSGTPVYDHAGELYRTGNRLDQTLTWSGGSDRTTYYLSMGRLSQEGVSGELRLRTDHGPVAWGHACGETCASAPISTTLTPTPTSFRQGSNISGIQLGALRTPPDFDNLIPDGERIAQVVSEIEPHERHSGTRL